MSRVIKFRAWVKYTTDHKWDWAYKKAEEKMAVNQDFDDDATRLRSEFMDEWDKNNSPESRYSHKEYMADLDEVSISLSGRLTRRINVEVLDLMQFTEIKDINGVGVYEGDIIKFSAYKSRPDSDYRIGVLVYNKGGYFFEYREDNKIANMIYGIEKSKLPQCYIEWAIEHDGICEVIGNIYENPELLGVK